MSLLPKEHGQFAKEGFWDEFFAARGSKAFDWYGEYPELCGVLHKYIKPDNQLLMVGCGNSKLSEDLYDLSYHNITNIDISDTVIRHMNQRNSKRRPKMTFTKMDATKMTFDDDQFKAAIDKGTLDAVLPDVEHCALASSMLDEVWRVVKSMGCYVIVSLAQDHVFRALVETFKDRPCIFRVHKLPKPDEDSGFMMPVFAFVITKLRPIPGMSTIWESSLLEETNTRHSSSEQLIMAVKEVQYYAILQQKLYKGHKLEDGEQPRVDLFSPENDRVPRYTIYVVDSKAKSKSNNKFAVFITPQGQESKWMYATNEGRLELLSSVYVDRVLVVTLSRGHKYRDVDQVKAELSSKVMELAPANTKADKVPFLTAAEGIGMRNVIHEVESKELGLIHSYDVNTDAHTMTRMTYCESYGCEEPFASAILKTVKSKKANTTTVQVDVSHLSCEIDRTIVSLVCQCDPIKRDGVPPALLIIGLRCGALASFISTYLRGITVEEATCVETAGALIDVAKRFYSLDDKLIIKQTDSYSPDSTLRHNEFTGYGCIIINTDLNPEIIEEYLPLMHCDGLFIVRHSKERLPSILSLLKDKHSHCYTFEFDKDCVTVVTDRVVGRDNSLYKNNLDKLQDKLKKMKVHTTNVHELISMDFGNMKLG